MNLASAAAIIADAWARGLRPDALMPLAQWSDEHRIIPKAGAAEPGRWRTSRTPYLAEIMDCFSNDSPVEDVTLMAGTQVGKTESGNNWVGYVVHMAPGPMMAVQPTIDMAKRYSRQRLAPMIEVMPVLRERIRDSRSRDSGNTVLSKEFDGGILIISGANSAASLRSMPVRYLFCDEVDAYPLDVDGEGDPLDLAYARTQTFARRKVFTTSTPTLKGFSKIEQRFDLGDQRRYFVPCPHCDGYQWLRWIMLRWPEGRPEEAAYCCEHCGALIEEHHKSKMLARGEWRATCPEHAHPKRRSYHLSSLYSPIGWESWAKLAAGFLEATTKARGGDKTALKTFINTRLAETYAEEAERADKDQLAARAEDYRLRTVPLRGLVLAAGVDVQDNRFEITVWAQGRGEEIWAIDYTVLDANPADSRDWDKLDAYLQTRFPHAGGQTLGIEATAIDTGGHFTHQAYAYCRARAHRRVFAIKGDTRQGGPIKGRASLQDINWQGKIIKRGVKLWFVGTDTAKDLLFGRLQVTEPGPGYVHFSKDLPPEFYAQLTAEARVLQRTARGEQYRWVRKPGVRNEVLDCTVYSLFAAHALDLHRYTDRMWEKLEKIVAPATRDIFDMPAADPSTAVDVPHETPAPTIAPRRRPGRAKFSVKTWSS